MPGGFMVDHRNEDRRGGGELEDIEGGGRPGILIFFDEPVQYASPQYRHFAADALIEVTLVFLSLAVESAADEDFGRRLRCDVPSLEDSDGPIRQIGRHVRAWL
jgi:hypothetical protein